MAAIHDLINQVGEPRLRDRLLSEWERTTREKKFGLVFEDHLPELLPLYDARPRRGDLVCRRTGALKDVLQVRRVSGDIATCTKPKKTVGDGPEYEPLDLPLDQLLVVRQFGDPIFPVLTPIDAVENGAASAPWHMLVEADNYHALQLLDYLYAGQVDCIYIDPPYNTGARDWKYNNDYVDSNDAWRHSKWLAMMQRRLELAKRLLSDHGVMIVTIDDGEFSHLDCLLEDMFPELTRYVVAIEHNKRGRRGKNFAKSNEFGIFLVRNGTEPISEEPFDGLGGQTRNLRRTGSGSLRQQRWKKFYPIYVDTTTAQVVEIGEPIQLDQERPAGVPRVIARKYSSRTIAAVWPVDEDGREKNWHYAAPRARSEAAAGKLLVRQQAYGWQVYFSLRQKDSKKFKTVWTGPQLDASTHGTELLESILGRGQTFDYPKSIYAVRQCLTAAVFNRPDALVVDFFAGSGTTLNAINLLNAADGGARRCILVTNNEVSASDADALRSRNVSPGDAAWEDSGVCRAVTWPRSKFTIRGQRDDGVKLPGEYSLGRSIELERPRRFTHIGFADAASLATARGKRQLVAIIKELPQSLVEDSCPYVVSAEHSVSVLFDDSMADAWLKALEDQDHITEFLIVAQTKRRFEAIRSDIEALLGPAIVSEDEKRPLAAGFQTNLEYFRLAFIDKDSVALRRAFKAILPLLWMKAGSIGRRPELLKGRKDPEIYIPDGTNFAVLLDEGSFANLVKELGRRTGITHVFIVTDADESFKDMAAELYDTFSDVTGGIRAVQLYRDYLSNFMINRGHDVLAVAPVSVA